MEPNSTIVIFDGVCNLCNGAVDFILTHDRTGAILFTSFQGEQGKQLLSGQGITEAPDTIYVVHNAQVFKESDAVLFLAGYMRQRWVRVLGILCRVLPRTLRNVIYRWIARNRYRWFGKKDHCRLPTAAEANRFL